MITRILQWILGCTIHQWSRAFFDPIGRNDYQLCLICGKRRNSPVQFHEVLKNES